MTETIFSLTSDRDFNLSFSSFEFDYVYNKATRLYAIVSDTEEP